jgi:hypothetical protein
MGRLWRQGAGSSFSAIGASGDKARDLLSARWGASGDKARDILSVRWEASGDCAGSSFGAMGHLHILVVKKRLTFISVTKIVGLVVMAQ